MAVGDNDLRLAERLIDETQRRIVEQRDCMARLRANGGDAAHTEQMLQAFETNLKLFEENKQLLIEEHKARVSRTLATHEEALAQLKSHTRIRELGENVRERLAKFR
jgi:hypothetical protein